MRRRKAPRRIAPGAVFTALIVLAIIAGLVYLALNQWVFVVRNVVVNGNGDIPAEEVIRLS
ncbi:MAG: hypothetical protein E7337_08550, partial [Clostridiales bacterium]|nr:hypothetical protein [Clostridiales bacterium]